MSSTAGSVAFIGADELSVELAASFLRSGARVRSFVPEAERSPSAALAELNGLLRCASPVEAARDAALVVVLSDAGGVDELFFGVEGIAKGLCAGCIVLIRSTLLPSQLEKLEQKLTDEKKDVFLLDGYIFSGLSDELKQQIVIVASGRQDIAERARKFFHSLYKTIYFAEGELCTSSKLRVVNDLLEGIHFVASIEAMYLGVRAGIHPSIIYDIISNAAGSSRIFVELVPKLLNEDPLLIDFLNSARKNASHVMYMAKSVTFPLPLLGVAYQQLIHGSSAVTADGSASPLKVWEASFGVNIVDAASQQIYDASKLADQLVMESKAAKQIGFIGLGAMGFGMASHLLKSGFCVVAYDVYKPTMARFADLGGSTKGSPDEVAKDVEILIIMVANESQADSVLFGNAGAVPVLSAGTSVMLSSTVSPGFVIHLNRRLEAECRQIKLVDAPVSGGVKRAADGTLTIMASGTDEALHCTGSVLSALSEKLYVIKGGCGAASSVKMVNQLLAGVHIASAAEAMSFAARLDLRTRRVFEIMQHARGYSWMFGNRVPHMLDNDYTPYSAVDIFVKDLGIVSSESSNSRIPVHVSTIAHQLFISGSASGWGRYDDAAIVKVYETLTGVKVEGTAPMLSKDVLRSLPAEWPEDPIDNLVSIASHSSKKILVVLDDDPTGTQTVHDIEVLTEWPVEALVEQFLKLPTCFFILTNSRSMTADKAMLLVQTICRNLEAAAKKVPGVSYTVVLRGDSTLRGHFPEEADAAVSVLGEMDAWIICPFFLQGGRYTINDVHYVADSDRLIPAGETEFAKDAAFGYKSSNLRQWVEEKTRGRVSEDQVSTISITLLRKQGPTAVCEHLCSLEKGSVFIVNAASDRDMAVFASGMIQAELKGKRFLCRTAASFVSARIGIKPKPPICPNDLGLKRALTGGLIIVGSYVPKTTKQVDELRSQCGQSLRVIEVSVEMVSMKSVEDRDQEISRIVELGNAYIQSRKDTLVLTSRQLITGKRRVRLFCEDDWGRDADARSRPQGNRDASSSGVVEVYATDGRLVKLNGPIEVTWSHGERYPYPKGAGFLCLYCHKKGQGGGVTRLKEHLAGAPGNVGGCPKVPAYIKDLMSGEVVKTRAKKGRSNAIRLFVEKEIMAANIGYGRPRKALDEATQLETATRESLRGSNSALENDSSPFGRPSGSGAASCAGNRQTRIDSFYQTPQSASNAPFDIDLARSRAQSQPRVDVMLMGGAKEKLGKSWAKWFHANDIPGRKTDCPYFRSALKLSQQLGEGVQIPTGREIDGPLLDMNFQDVEAHMSQFKEDWHEYSVTIMCDSWTGPTLMSIINFMVYCNGRMFFLKSVNATGLIQNADYIHSILREVVHDDVGEKCVVQIVTDNGANYKKACRMIIAEFKHITWQPCAAHTINLMLRDIATCFDVECVVDSAKRICRFLYKHNRVHAMMREKIGGELIRWNATRFGTVFIFLKSFWDRQDKFKQWMISDDWESCRTANEEEHDYSYNCLTSKKWWSEMELVLKAVTPLYSVLRFADQ